MDYRRRYLRRLANQNQQNKVEEKPVQEKTEDKQNQNVYLQKLLEKKNVPTGSTINISSVNESIPSFKTNIRDIFSTEENKQKAIKYVIRRNEERYGQRSGVTVNNNQGESNPVLSNKYYHYSRYTSNNNSNNNNNNTPQNVSYLVDNNNSSNVDNKGGYQHYYRRNRYYVSGSGLDANNNNQDNKNDNSNKKEEPVSTSSYSRKRFPVSLSTTNINEKDDKDNTNNNANNNNTNTSNSVYRRRNQNNANTSINSPNEKKEPIIDTKPQPRFRYIRGYVKKDENSQNQEKTEEKKPNEQNNVTSIPLNLKIGYNFSFGVKEDNESSKTNTNTKNDDIANNIGNTKRYTYARKVYKYGDNLDNSTSTSKNVMINRRNERKKDYVKESVIKLKILSGTSNDNNSSRYKRKYVKFSKDSEMENLTFKDEKELMDFLKRKYDQDKIIELLNKKA